MGRKPKSQQITGTLGQHLALSAAAYLVSSQLLLDLSRVRDPRQGSGILNIIGDALATVAPLYIQDPGMAAPRPLLQAELEGSEVQHGATVLRLKDGRMLSRIWMKRADLRHAIAVLKTVGIPKLGDERKPQQQPRQEQPLRRHGELHAKAAEIVMLVRPPLVPSEMIRVNALAISIARSAPDGHIANLAMRLLSAVHDARIAGDGADTREIELMAVHLRNAIHEADKGNG